jgi:hypothetical protein
MFPASWQLAQYCDTTSRTDGGSAAGAPPAGGKHRGGGQEGEEAVAHRVLRGG